jgi:excisionase family DNA binding protein
MPEGDEEVIMLNISEAARRIGVSAKTLRSWADKGLVPHVRLPSGYRRFTPEQVEQVRQTMIRGTA